MANSLENKRPSFIFVHGFLGLPADWVPLQSELQKKYENPFVSLNLWDLVGETTSLKSLAAKIQSHGQEGSVVIGYSLGGRLLMHLSKEYLQKAKAIILVSTHLGLRDDTEKQVRQSADNQWAQRFLDEPWELLMESWDSQDIFKNDGLRPERLENNYHRLALSQVISKCSLGSQDLWGGNLTSLKQKTLHIVGGKDLKFQEMQQQLKMSYPEIKYETIENMGHFGLMTHNKDLFGLIDAFLHSKKPVQTKI